MIKCIEYNDLRNVNLLKNISIDDYDIIQEDDLQKGYHVNWIVE